MENENEKQKMPAPAQPSFPHGTVVTSPALVVDRNGVAWWVHPASRTLYKAAAL